MAAWHCLIASDDSRHSLRHAHRLGDALLQQHVLMRGIASHAQRENNLI